MHSTHTSGRKALLVRRVLVLAASSVLLGGSPLLMSAPAAAQNRSGDGYDLRLERDRPIRAVITESETLYLNNNRTYNYDLQVRRPITIDGTLGGLEIPRGSVIRGRFEPAPGGLRYVARSVEIDGRTYRLNATSEVITDRKDPRDTSVGGVATDAAIGAAGGALISEILGRASLGAALGGAVVGGVVGNVTADRVVVVEPDQPIALFSR